MAIDRWAAGRLKAVYHPIGLHDNGEPRLRRANCDVLFWDGNNDGVEEQYMVAPSVTPNGFNTTQIQETFQQHELGVMFGFYIPGYEVLDVTNPGNADNLLTLHTFGFY